ncbi:small heat shock protein [Hysterangium stoloniferum]|nr:small heat shock protein [Hysterangium stoloniferum]
MSLITYFYDNDPFFNFSEFNHLFDEAWNTRTGIRSCETARDLQRINNGSGSAINSIRPKMDLHESKESGEMTATFELPGMKKEDVTIDVHNNHLMVSGQSTFSNDLEKDGYSIRERRFGKFSRTIPLPAGTKPENVKASMEHGLLAVRFPRSNPEQEVQRIAIT